MKAMPTDDPIFGKGSIREDGRKLHPVYLFRTKSPAQSKGPWDFYEILSTIPPEKGVSAARGREVPDGEGLIRRVAVVGTGVIGASWASQFLAQGLEVSAFDPAAGWAARLQATVAAQWPVLEAMGLAAGADAGRLRIAETLEGALEGAEFVQENGPERLEAKRALFGAMDAACGPDVVIASSSSTLKVSDVQAGLRHPGRVVLGHPFNPPHLIPLVEVVGGAATSAAAVDVAMAFYAQIGKRPIRLKRRNSGMWPIGCRRRCGRRRSIC